MQVERDPITGVDTTGHEWDGIKELSTPIPKVAIIGYLLATLGAAAMWYLLPSFPVIGSKEWPYVTANYTGATGYTDRKRADAEIAAVGKQQVEHDKRFTEREMDDLAGDDALRATAFDAGETLFRENCAMCHGRKGVGQHLFPNLRDNQWLWSGEPEGIYATIKYGINARHDETQEAEMPAFLKDETLTRDQVKDVVEYTLSLSQRDHLNESAKRGAEVFEENCTGCHDEGGKGGMENGAPNLTDNYWIYGGNREAITRSISFGRKGVMPHWVDRLRDAEIRQLALYVKWLSDDYAAEQAAEEEASSDAKSQ